MSSEHKIAGELYQYDEPDWQPLYDLIGVDLADWFMWMHEIELEDGVRVHAYKHIDTRRYFHLGVDGRAFVYLWRGGGYQQIDRREVIDLVFARWQELCAEEHHDRIRAGLRRARRAETVRARKAASQES